MKYFSIFLVSFFVLIPYAAFAEEIPVQIKTLNDTDLMIFGTISNPDDNPVSILITDQSGDLIRVAQIMPDDMGNFSLNITKQGPLWDNIKEFYVKAIIPDSQAIPPTAEKSYREGIQPDDDALVSVNFQVLKASQAKCTILGPDGIEACNLQAFLTLGIFTSAIIGTVIAVSMITLRRSIRKNR